MVPLKTETYQCPQRNWRKEKSVVTTVRSMDAETQKHIDLVRLLLRIIANALRLRGEDHDKSKFSPEEAEAFALVGAKLRGSTYGSEEYIANLEAIRPALQHHYANNRHHPEHHANGVNDMNLVDLVEMFADWFAATYRHADGDIFKGIDINTVRFGMDRQLVSILQNTARYFADPQRMERDLDLSEPAATTDEVSDTA